jgi:hypothetical protein
MGICKDPRLTYLNDLGYDVIRLPRRGIAPLVDRDGLNDISFDTIRE